jgi:riboflavin kinase/FMN adenylyltransferase
MNVYHDLHQLPNFRNAVVTIGSFDGVHHGHQQIVKRLNDLAVQYEGESVVVTFHPHPRLVVAPDSDNLQLLTTIDEKIALLKRFGVDQVVVVPFTKEFSQQTPTEYIENFLMDKFKPKCIVIGYDHRFGRAREGNIDLIRDYAAAHQFEVVEIEKQAVDEIAVSSTRIRKALLKGEVQEAFSLLEHYFTLTGTVVKGQQIGTRIGFPTANVQVVSTHKLIPPDGIYAVYVRHQKERYKGMLYIGRRPTIEDENARSIEVNIFSFNKNIYGDKITLELVSFVREDVRFDSLDQLKTQLAEDERSVKRYFNQLEATEQAAIDPSKLASVAVVILNYNGQAQLEQFLPSVLETTYQNTEIYIADNRSTDDSLTWLSATYPEVQIVVLDQNYGFAEGYNRALVAIETDYIVLLNSDVEVTSNWIEPILELMESNPQIGVCQPKILSQRQPTHFEHAGAAGGWIDRLNYPFCRGRILETVEADNGQYDSNQEIFWASGAAFFIRRKLYQELGGFAGYFFAHLEEIDLCWRIQRAGYKVMVCPSSVVYHVGGATLPYGNARKVYLNFRNSLFAIVRNEESSRLFPVLLARLLLDGAAAVSFLAKGQLKNIVAIIRAHWHFFPRFRQLLRERKTINDQIERVSIQNNPELKGRYNGSIIWQYYVMGRRKFKELKAK